MIASSTIRALQRANEIESSFLASVIQLFLKAIGDRNPEPLGALLKAKWASSLEKISHRLAEGTENLEYQRYKR
jgi:hypothetical protein